MATISYGGGDPFSSVYGTGGRYRPSDGGGGGIYDGGGD